MDFGCFHWIGSVREVIFLPTVSSINAGVLLVYLEAVREGYQPGFKQHGDNGMAAPPALVPSV